jgi:type VI secretion system protein VasD
MKHPVTSAIAGFVAAILLLSGCASSNENSGLLDKSLELMGVQKPNVPDLSGVPAPRLDKRVPLRIHAAERVNTDPSGRSLSVVLRIYKLKEPSAFLLASSDAFKSAQAEQAAFGGAIAEVREVTLTPGQKSETTEILSAGATHIGVVALFRAPAPDRWRFAFDAKASETKGITLGIHGCAIGVAVGEPIGAPPESLRLGGIQCK